MLEYLKWSVGNNMENIIDCEVVLELTECKKLIVKYKEWEGCEECGQIRDGDSAIIHKI